MVVCAVSMEQDESGELEEDESMTVHSGLPQGKIRNFTAHQWPQCSESLSMPSQDSVMKK